MKLKNIDTPSCSGGSVRNLEIAFRGVNASFTAMVRRVGLLIICSLM